MIYAIFAITTILAELRKSQLENSAKKWALGILAFILTTATMYLGIMISSLIVYFLLGMTAPNLADHLINNPLSTLIENLVFGIPAAILSIVYVPKLVIGQLAKPKRPATAETTERFRWPENVQTRPQQAVQPPQSEASPQGTGVKTSTIFKITGAVALLIGLATTALLITQAVSPDPTTSDQAPVQQPPTAPKPTPTLPPIPNQAPAEPQPAMLTGTTEQSRAPVAPTLEPDPLIATLARIQQATPVAHTSTNSIFFVENDEQISAEAEALALQARTYSEKGQFQEALRLLTRANQANSQQSRTIENLIGLTLMQLERYDEAIAHITTAIQIKDIPLYRINRAIVYSSTYQCEKALEDLAKAATQTDKPEDSTHLRSKMAANLAAANCHIRLGNHQKAEEQLHLAQQMENKPGSSARGSLTLNTLKQHFEEIKSGHSYPEDLLAEADLKKWSEAMNLILEEQPAQAIPLMLKVLENTNPPPSKAKIELAWAYWSLGRHEEALHHINQAVALRQDAYTLSQRANLHLETDNCPQAITDSTEALLHKTYIVPGYNSAVESHWTIGLCQLLQGDTTNANPHLRTALELAQKSEYTQKDMEDITFLLSEEGQQLSAQQRQVTQTAIPTLVTGPADCDTLLRAKLITQTDASSAEQIAHTIDLIQLEQPACSRTAWNPRSPTTYGGQFQIDNDYAQTSEREASSCFTPAQTVDAETNRAQGLLAVGGIIVPSTLRIEGDPSYSPNRASSRDVHNNIIVYWAPNPEERPANQARCWLYTQATGIWSHN